MMSIVRYQLMSYINVYAFFEDPEKAWRKKIAEEKNARKTGNPTLSSPFSLYRGLAFEN